MVHETKKHKVLCIVCPEGCEMEVTDVNGELTFPKGVCRRGQDYAHQEIVNPCRVLTTTVRLNGGDVNMLPVRTSDPIPKQLLTEAMQQIASITTTAPVNIGDMICDDIAGTGIALHACRTIGTTTI